MSLCNICLENISLPLSGLKHLSDLLNDNIEALLSIYDSTTERKISIYRSGYVGKFGNLVMNLFSINTHGILSQVTSKAMNGVEEWITTTQTSSHQATCTSRLDSRTSSVTMDMFSAKQI